MDDAVALRRGLTARALTVDDIDDVIALANVCEMHDVGYPMWEREDLTSDLRLPGVDIERDTVGVRENEGRLVGWGFMPNERGAWVDVHPDVRGSGIGTWLRTWTEDRARERGAERVGQTINDRATDTVRLLVDAGYTPRRTSWILSMVHEERPPDPTPPDGVTLRPYRPGDDEEALGMFEDAFAEWPDRTPSTIATWRAMTIERDGFSSEDLVLAEAGGEIVGGAFIIDSDEIWVDKLAVRRDHRHRGIARALLQVAFQRGFDRGYAASTLSTDSNTGALALYERVGMQIRETYSHLAIDL
jgi:mycothiol synthase